VPHFPEASFHALILASPRVAQRLGESITSDAALHTGRRLVRPQIGRYVCKKRIALQKNRPASVSLILVVLGVIDDMQKM
jgi:hypothetical protein